MKKSALIAFILTAFVDGYARHRKLRDYETEGNAKSESTLDDTGINQNYLEKCARAFAERNETLTKQNGYVMTDRDSIFFGFMSGTQLVLDILSGKIDLPKP